VGPDQQGRVAGFQVVLNHGSPPEMKKAAPRRLKGLLDEKVVFTLEGKLTPLG
jgi:hypothetical protein